MNVHENCSKQPLHFQSYWRPLTHKQQIAVQTFSDQRRHSTNYYLTKTKENERWFTLLSLTKIR